MKRGGHGRQEAGVFAKAVGETFLSRGTAARPSLTFTLFSRVLLAGLVVVLVSGCGRYKQDLEEAKQRIDKLTADNRKCAEMSADLEKEKQRLSDQRKAVDTRMEALIKELAVLKKTNMTLTDELAGLKKKNSELSSAVNTLKQDKTDLSKQLEDLKKRAAEPEQPVGRPPVTQRDASHPTAARIKTPRAQEKKMTPCDAIIAFMKASEKAIREKKGQERSKMLKRIKEEYGPRIQGAPKKAVTNAEAWVEEAARSWDKPGDDFVFDLLTKRNAVLDACGKKPTEAGF